MGTNQVISAIYTRFWVFYSIDSVMLTEFVEEMRFACCCEFINKFNVIGMDHQWVEGNLPVSSHCAVCERKCGSVRRLQDFRCLWCKDTVRISHMYMPA